MNMQNSNRSHWRKKGFFFFLFISAAVFGAGALVMFLWNAILPSLLHVSEIMYWQALGLLVLCRLLFGSFRFGGRGYHYGGGWREKYKNMTEEEREALKNKWKERCGNWK
jgi:hypothetical protein